MFVLTYGNFDILHVQHFNLLSYCRSLAGDDGKVVVAIAADGIVSKQKGLNRPIFSQTERKRQLFLLKNNFVDCGSQVYIVNNVNIFNTNEELYSIIKSFKPNVIVLGEDQQGKKIIGEDICDIRYFSYHPEYSTTDIIRKVVKAYSGNNI